MIYISNPERRAGGFTVLSKISSLQAFEPYLHKDHSSGLKRKTLQVPIDKGLFIKPIKQSFVKNPRLMPMTRLMLTLLSGWAGQGGSIKTTIGIIAKHIGRSSRMVFNYLKDAVEEGYLYYSRTKDRIGRYTGICIRLNFGAIRHHSRKNKPNAPKAAEKLAMKYSAETNSKSIYNTKNDEQLWKKLIHFGSKLGYFEKDQDRL